MGNGMSRIITGLYVGNIRDAKDEKQLNDNQITHIISVHDNAKELVKGKKYKCIIASDSPSQSLSEFFPECIEFIHEARIEGGNVLVHCLAGVSRSVTITAAYIMTVTDLGWRKSLNAIRGARNGANPNFGFQKQLQNYESERLEKARKDLHFKYPVNKFEDQKECEEFLKCYQNFLITGERHNVLYSLPHRAYGERTKSNNTTATDNVETNSTSVGQERNDGLDIKYETHENIDKEQIVSVRGSSDLKMTGTGHFDSWGSENEEQNCIENNK